MIRILRAAALTTALLLLVSCAPVWKIGYMGGLTGRLSDLGYEGRNGVQLAVEQINGDARFGSPRLELIIVDDSHRPEVGVAAMEELAAAGVRAVVGPMTSDIALAVVPLADSYRIPLVSPTASTGRLTGIDDYFLRVNPPDTAETVDLARIAIENGLERILVFTDLSNESFSRGLAGTFISSFAGDGRATEVVGFDSRESPSYAHLVEAVDPGAWDGALIVAGTIDTALIAQQLRIGNREIELFGTGWAMTKDLIVNGGAAVEGMRFSHYFDDESNAGSWRKFVADYRERFGADPTFFAALSYMSTRVIWEGMLEAGSAGDLRDAVVGIGEFEGLQGKIRIDAFGDADLERFSLVIRDGRLQRLE